MGRYMLRLGMSLVLTMPYKRGVYLEPEMIVEVTPTNVASLSDTVCGRALVGIRCVSRPDLDRPPAAIYARTKKRKGHVTSRIGNGRTAAIVH